MKILYLSDDPRLPTGYGNLGKSFCKFLTRNHEITVLGGAQRLSKPLQWEGVQIFPVANYGTPDEVRYHVREQKPDVLLVNTDPRFLQQQVFLIDNEIRKQCPVVFYHLWDDAPFPVFNVPLYRSCDSIIAGSKFTYDLLRENQEQYELPPIYSAPIGINTDVYKPLAAGETQKTTDEILKSIRGAPGNAAFPTDFTPRFIVGFIGRFGHRKRLIDMMRMFSKFAQDKKDVLLILHTTVRDESGNLGYVIDNLFKDMPIAVSFTQAQPDEAINRLYNVFDVTLNVSHAEGFGMPLIESMSAGTPCISAKTAGPSGFMNNENGWLLEPVVITTIGSTVVPFINDRFVNDEQVINALEEAYSNKSLLMQKASKCRETIKKYHTERCMVEVLEKALIETKENWQPQPDYTLTQFPEREEA